MENFFDHIAFTFFVATFIGLILGGFVFGIEYFNNKFELGLKDKIVNLFAGEE